MEILIVLAIIGIIASQIQRIQNRRRPPSRPTTSRPTRPVHGPGSSAARRAAQLRRVDAEAAARWDAGAAGERATAKQLIPLQSRGYGVIHDRALPGTRANLDHLVIAPCGRLILPDTKQWSQRHPVHSQNDLLFHGSFDRTSSIDAILAEAEAVSRAMGGLPVVPLMVIRGAPIRGAELMVQGVRIIRSHRLPAVIESLTGPPNPEYSQQLAWYAHGVFPAYL